MFTGISDPGLGRIFGPRLGNMMVLNAGYSFQPLANSPVADSQRLQIRLDGFGYFRETGGAISESGIDPDSTDRYLGFESDLSVNYRPLSDLGFGLSAGVFLPNGGGAFDSAERDTEYLVRLNTSFSF